MAIEITLNGRVRRFDVPQDKPLLWVLREDAGLTGTKYGCGIAQCGACTVLIDNTASRACVLPVSAAAGKQVETIEGISGRAAEAVQAAWRELDVVQCGYCQSGQVVAAAALLASNAKPSDTDIDTAMGGNLCRCATYHRIRAAIHRAADIMEA